MEHGDFEDFLERLLGGLKHADLGADRVASFARYGRPGDRQHGRDFMGTLADGRSFMWQAKAYGKFTAGDFHDALQATAEPSDCNFVVISCLASSPLRDTAEATPGWDVIDRRDLMNLLSDVPTHRRREILDDTFGPAVRRTLMASPGQDPVITLDAFTASRQSDEVVVNDVGPFAGRTDELAALREALKAGANSPAVVVVEGPGGRGKTRLVLQALHLVQETDPLRPVLCVAPGWQLSMAVIEDLPGRPAVIVVDDVHRGLTDLPALLRYAERVPDTQLVLVTRSGPLPAVLHELAAVPPARLLSLPVGVLSALEAKELVDGLTEGMDLSWAFRNWLRQQALEAPHIAVIATRLVRDAALDGTLKTSDNLRSRVLAGYADITSEPLEGVAPEAVRRVVAVLATLGRVAPEDPELVARIAELSGLTRPALLRVIGALVDRGVVTDPESGAWVVTPELLGDSTADEEAVAGGFDSGFAHDVWEAFKVSRFLTLFPSLCELGWRVREKHGIDVVDRVWQEARDVLLAADADLVCGTLDRAGTLPVFDSARTVGLLEDLLGLYLPRRGEATLPDPYEWPRARTADDVLYALAPLLAEAAKQDSTLLPPALDALWALRRGDARAPHQREEHPERALAEGPGNLAVAGVDVAAAVVERVAAWLGEPARPDDVDTPLFALRSLVVKEGTRTEQTSGKTLTFHPYLIDPERVRDLRDAIRQVLQEQASGPDLRRAGQALDLLGEMLRRPRGLFGTPISADMVLAWADDDMATFEVLRDVAGSTSSAVVRRCVRNEIAQTATRALSPELRHAALLLATALDERTEDDLAELLLHERHDGEPSLRGHSPPQLDEVRTHIAKAADRAAEGQDSQEARQEAIHRLLELRSKHYDELNGRIADWLAGQDLQVGVAELRACAEEVALARPGRQPSLWALYRTIGREHPDLVGPLTVVIDAAIPSALDDNLALLLAEWETQDRQALLEWLTPLTDRRAATRRAVAQCFASHGWTQRESVRALFADGVADSDAAVRDAFLMASNDRLTISPGDAAGELLAAGASAWACRRALQGACNHDGTAWGRGLSAEDGIAVLRLIDRAGWDDWTLQHIASGLAQRHPITVLEHLAGHEQLWRTIPDGIDGLAAAFAQQAELVAQWIVTEGARLTRGHLRDLAGLALGERVPPALASEFVAAASTLDRAALAHLLQVLEAVPTWPQNAPLLARTLLERSRALDGEAHQSTGRALRDAMHLRSYGGVNGVSEELNAAVIESRHAAASEGDEELRELYDQAATELQAMADRDLAQHQQDEDLL